MDTYTDQYEISRPYKQFIDISLSFEPNALTGDILTLKNERAINNSIENIILSLPGETPFNHDMGSQVSNYLFELNSPGPVALLTQEIERAIRFNEPRVELLGVEIVDTDNGHSFSAQITYKIIGYEEVITFTSLLEPTR